MKSLLILTVALFAAVATGLTEEERVAGYHARNYTWPIPKFQPDTPGWSELMSRRLRQVSEIQGYQDRFEGYAQTLSASFVQVNYTEHGFGLARAPDDLMEALRQGIRDGLEAGPEEEYYIPEISGLRPWFIDRPDLTKRVVKELQHFPETWAGVELEPVLAYGFRLYRNESTLYMHVDKAETHVVSFILHIDSSEDAEPWPILIEDFQGNSHEVILTSGDLLFYESSKCFHGRPRPLNGSWYSSVFVHYHPKYDYADNFNFQDKVYAIPPKWDVPPTTRNEVPVAMHGTAFEEPECPHGWCATETSKKWSGPGVEGHILHPNGEKEKFDPKPFPCEDKDPKCQEWVSWDTNECERNAKFMLRNCAKSCQACTPQGHDEL